MTFGDFKSVKEENSIIKYNLTYTLVVPVVTSGNIRLRPWFFNRFTIQFDHSNHYEL